MRSVLSVLGLTLAVAVVWTAAAEGAGATDRGWFAQAAFRAEETGPVLAAATLFLVGGLLGQTSLGFLQREIRRPPAADAPAVRSPRRGEPKARESAWERPYERAPVAAISEISSSE